MITSEKDEKIERTYLKELITRKIDGLIVAPVSVRNLKLAKDNQIPFVVINEKITWVDSFYTSLFNAGVEVAKFFKEKNYSRVGYIGENISKHNGAIVPPIYQNILFVFEN